MEKELLKTDTKDLFDFKKNNTIEKKIEELYFPSRKRMALITFIYISFGFSASLGFEFGNYVVDRLNYHSSKNQIEKKELVTTQEQKIKETIPQQDKEKALLEQQKQIDFSVNKIKSIDNANFNKFTHYLEAHKNLYDERLKVIRKSLFDAQSIDRRNAVDPNTTCKELEFAIINYKKGLDDIITNITSIYSSAKENSIKESKVNFNDLQAFLRFYRLYENGLIHHDRFIEFKIKNILYIKNQANVDYNSQNDIFNLDEKINQETETNIKKFKI